MAAGEIRVLNWQGYGTDEAFATEAFEKKTGVKVVHDYFTSEQEMLTKLRTNPGAYDVVLINSAFTGQAAAEGPDRQDRHRRHAERQGPRTQPWPERRSSCRDGDVYGVAWTWGVTGACRQQGQGEPASHFARPSSGIRNMPARCRSVMTAWRPSSSPPWRSART